MKIKCIGKDMRQWAIQRQDTNQMREMKTKSKNTVFKKINVRRS